MSWSGKVAVVGAYESPRRQAPDVHPFQIHSECVRGALEDAGLRIEDVDGLAATAGLTSEGGAWHSVIEVAEYLGIQPSYVDGSDIGGCAPLAHASHAAAAIVSGMAEVVVLSYAACPRSFPLPLSTGEASTLPAGPGQFEVPYGPTLVASYALIAQRHMAEFGTTPEQLAEPAVVARRHAAGNPDARYREPIEVDDVLRSPMIASPLHRLDCCVVTDGGGAVVLTSEERARDCRKAPVWLLGGGESVSHMTMSQMASLTETPGRRSGARAFAMAGMTPDDVDVAQLYDAFTITPLLALEDLGFCEKGDGGPFVAAGNLEAGGRVPFNTDGGGLSSNHPGRRGLLLMVEAVRQLRGEGPGVQVAEPRVALVHGLGGVLSATATLVLGV